MIKYDLTGLKKKQMTSAFMGSSIGRVKSMISNLAGGIMLRAEEAGGAIQIRKQKPRLPELGLKTLMYPQEESPDHHAPLPIHSYMISSSKTPSSSLFRSLSESSSYSSWTSALEDLIGTESGVYISSLNDSLVMEVQEYPSSSSSSSSSKRNRVKQSSNGEMAREYPPPIPLLARTGNLAGHMPWVLIRHYDNGKLRLNVEKVKHHEYIEAHREDNRLVLNLVSMDDTIRDYPLVCDQTIDVSYEEDEAAERSMSVWSNETSFASSVPKCCFEISGRERCGDLRKCFTYAGSALSESGMFCSNQEQSRTMPVYISPPTTTKVM